MTGLCSSKIAGARRSKTSNQSRERPVQDNHSSIDGNIDVDIAPEGEEVVVVEEEECRPNVPPHHSAWTRIGLVPLKTGISNITPPTACMKTSCQPPRQLIPPHPLPSTLPHTQSQ
jgi:hypothetical protein